jgi:hypothetical protein
VALAQREGGHGARGVVADTRQREQLRHRRRELASMARDDGHRGRVQAQRPAG